MRYSLPKAASLAVLAGALLLPAVPASATATTTAQTAAVQDDPFSVFKITLKAPKKVKAGGKVTYKLSAVNTGPYYANAWFVGGEFPKGVDLKKIRFDSSIPKTQCFGEGRAFFCFADAILEKGDAVSLNFYAQFKKNAKGSQKATLGIVNYDVDQGMEDMSKEELDRLGVPVRGYAKSVTTKIAR